MKLIKKHEQIEADWREERGDYAAAQALRDCPWEIGKTYYFRLATYAWCGTVRAVGPNEIVLEPAAWVADSGRFANAMAEGLTSVDQSEIEPVDGRVIIGRGALIDSVEYPHDVPEEQK